MSFCFCASVGSGSTSSSGLTGNYIPSFLKKEVGSAVQRVHLAPIPDPSPGESYLGLFMKQFIKWFPLMALCQACCKLRTHQGRVDARQHRGEKRGRQDIGNVGVGVCMFKEGTKP